MVTDKELWGPEEEKISSRWGFGEGLLKEMAFEHSFRNGKLGSGSWVEGMAGTEAKKGGGKGRIAESCHLAALGSSGLSLALLSHAHPASVSLSPGHH